MSEKLTDRLRAQLPTVCTYDHTGPYHAIGMGYADRALIAEAADRIEELERWTDPVSGATREQLADIAENRRLALERSADALERAERVVEAARAFVESMTFQDGMGGFPIPGLAANWRATRDALAAYDAGTNAATVPPRADTVRDETLTSAQARGGANEWETFIAADRQPAIRRKRANSADQHKPGLSVSEEDK